jgi:hypothetical protein
MNPWSLAPLALVAVGNGGNEDVSVVARRVGLKRREDAWQFEYQQHRNIKRSNSCFVLCAAKSGRSRVGPQASPAAYR